MPKIITPRRKTFYAHPRITKTGATQMIVSMWMTRDLVTIGPDTLITEAAALMSQNHIHRLLVVETNHQGTHLLGIVSARDILHAFPSDVNPFAVAAPDTQMKPVRASQIMSRRLQTTNPETPTEEAARLMTENNIGSLPVLRGGKLVGLVTESDIFRAFVSFFETPLRGARITFDISSGENIFDFISHEAHRRKLRILSLISSHQENLPVCVVRIAGNDVDALLDDLWNSGHRVINVLRFD
jgi:acetoin utilization protein AcuB